MLVYTHVMQCVEKTKPREGVGLPDSETFIVNAYPYNASTAYLMLSFLEEAALCCTKSRREVTGLRGCIFSDIN